MNEKLRVLIYQEGDFWIAQCLEYDILAQASSFDEVRDEFEIALELALDENGEVNRGPAPEFLQGLWDGRSADVKPTRPMNLGSRRASFGMVAA